MSRFWSDIVHQLDPYVPGEQPKISNLIKLNTNENPYGPSPKVIEAIQSGTGDSLKLYPDPNSDKLKQSIADYYGLATDQVFVGNGSDEVLAHIFQGLLKQDLPILFPDISYSFYPVYCGLYKIDYETIALDAEFKINPNDYSKPNGGIIFPNPNAPTGRLLALDAIAQIAQQNPNSLVVVDEAYIDFGGESAVKLIDRFDNLLVTQTFSKSRSLAGLRLGMAMGNKDLIEGLERVKNSFNSYPVDRLSELAGVASIQDQDYFLQTCNRIIQTRESLTQSLEEMGFDVIPSAANFVFVRHSQQQAEYIAQQLRERAIIVRYFNKPRINEYLRITIGTEQEVYALVKALAEIIQ